MPRTWKRAWQTSRPWPKADSSLRERGRLENVLTGEPGKDVLIPSTFVPELAIKHLFINNFSLCHRNQAQNHHKSTKLFLNKYQGGGRHVLAVSSVILAGGQSRRMGINKALLKVGGRPIIERVIEKVSLVGEEVILVTNTPDECAYLGCPMVADVYPGKGSLGGIYSGLKVVSNPYALVVACDMPFLNASLLRYMALLSPGHDVIVPRTGQGIEPLHALYSKACLPAIELSLQQSNMRTISFYSQVRVRYVEQEEIETLDPQRLSFFNVNSTDDLRRAREVAAD